MRKLRGEREKNLKEDVAARISIGSQTLMKQNRPIGLTLSVYHLWRLRSSRRVLIEDSISWELPSFFALLLNSGRCLSAYTNSLVESSATAAATTTTSHSVNDISSSINRSKPGVETTTIVYSNRRHHTILIQNKISGEKKQGESAKARASCAGG